MRKVASSLKIEAQVERILLAALMPPTHPHTHLPSGWVVPTHLPTHPLLQPTWIWTFNIITKELIRKRQLSFTHVFSPSVFSAWVLWNSCSLTFSHLERVEMLFLQWRYCFWRRFSENWHENENVLVRTLRWVISNRLGLGFAIGCFCCFSALEMVVKK